MATRDQIIYALRCSSSPRGMLTCKKAECPFFTVATQEEIDEFNKANDVDFDSSFFDGCDCDRICEEAADYLEENTCI